MAQQYTHESKPCSSPHSLALIAYCGSAWLMLLSAMLALQACAPQTSAWNGTAAPGSNPFAENAPAPAACGTDTAPAALDANGLSDTQLGDDMTQYFRAHCLPLVSARVARDSAGQRRVILYGFVASDFGKSDAQRKAQQLLGGGAIALDNNILIRPQIAAMGQQQNGTPEQPANSQGAQPGVQQYEAQQPPGVQQYQAQQAQQHSWVSTLAPLLGGLSIGGGSFIGGGGMMVSPGMGMMPMAPMYPGYPPYPGMAPVYPGAMPIIP